MQSALKGSLQEPPTLQLNSFSPAIPMTCHTQNVDHVLKFDSPALFTNNWEDRRIQTFLVLKDLYQSVGDCFNFLLSQTMERKS